MTQTSMFVKMVFHPGKRDEGIAALEKMLPVVVDEHGTLVYSFHLDAGDENTCGSSSSTPTLTPSPPTAAATP